MEYPVQMIDIGPMTSMSSFHEVMSRQLSRYREDFRMGLRPELTFFSDELTTKRVNISCLAALLVVAERLRSYAPRTPMLQIRWNPQLFSFLHDVGFFDLARALDILCIDDEIVGGYSASTTNPSTQIIYAPRIENWSSNQSGLADEKDDLRSTIRDKLVVRCGDIFRPSRRGPSLPTEMRDQVLITAAELVVNANLWGDSSAFLALQRSGTRITVSVCDGGIGLLRSLQTKKQSKRIQTATQPHSDVGALVMGSSLNQEGFGLRRTIDMVTSNSGWVAISTFRGAITWRREAWRIWKSATTDQEFTGVTPESILTQLIHQYPNVSFGVRDWKLPLRGTRVQFEIPLTTNG